MSLCLRDLRHHDVTAANMRRLNRTIISLCMAVGRVPQPLAAGAMAK
jgi:hypothetical protein